MDYKKELKKLQKHRYRYYPLLSMLMDLYDNARPGDVPVELINNKNVLIILELIDIGYLDENALIIRRRFDYITSLVFNGRYPLTENGELFYQKEKHTLKGRIAGLINAFLHRP